ncbi:MAG: FHA domain-containing protein [Anaerolineae bacterium]|nr:FHA domain-containing protein [Anaerolineae bacterium]
MTTLCPRCHYTIVEGMTVCRVCGYKLRDEDSTREIPNIAQVVGRPDAGTAEFNADNQLALFIPSASHTITLIPTHCTVLGRFDPNKGISPPDLDLTPYGAFQHGVSRRHAAIYREGEGTLTVADLGSSNHTYLNGEQLKPRDPRILCDGDEVRLGDLILRVYFK